MILYKESEGKMKMLFGFLVVFVLCSFATYSQTITIPPNPWSYSDAQAATVFLSAREDYMTDTIVNIHIGTSVKWVVQQSLFYQIDSTAFDSIKSGVGTGRPMHLLNIVNADSIKIFNFSVDSIVARGDLRQVLLTTTFKTTNSSSWFITKERYHLASSNQGSVYDTLGITKDSTTQCSTWLWYTIRVNPTTATNGIGVGKYLIWDIFQNGIYGKLKIWLEKVVGNPVSFNGQNQIARLHFLVEEEPPQTWIDKYLNGK